MPAPFDLFSPFKYFNIAPVTDWERFINPQFNVTINQGDAGIENRVLARAGSYGKQIGRMQEVLDVLITRIPPDTLQPAEARSIEKYQETRSEVTAAVEAAKPGSGSTATSDDVNTWLDRLAALRGSDREQFERLAARIEQFLAADAEPAVQTRTVAPTSRKRSRK